MNSSSVSMTNSRNENWTCGCPYQIFNSAFCNFDQFITGFCEDCTSETKQFETKHDCDNDGLPLKGANECKKVCVKD